MNVITMSGFMNTMLKKLHSGVNADKIKIQMNVSSTQFLGFLA